VCPRLSVRSVLLSVLSTLFPVLFFPSIPSSFLFPFNTFSFLPPPSLSPSLPSSLPPSLPPCSEHLEYHALARMGGKHRHAEAKERVTEVVEQLGLTKAVDTVIGGTSPLFSVTVGREGGREGEGERNDLSCIVYLHSLVVCCRRAASWKSVTFLLPSLTPPPSPLPPSLSHSATLSFPPSLFLPSLFPFLPYSGYIGGGTKTVERRHRAVDLPLHPPTG